MQIWNPGQKYGSFQVKLDGKEILKRSRVDFGFGTNNEAEFNALKLALDVRAQVLVVEGIGLGHGLHNSFEFETSQNLNGIKIFSKIASVRKNWTREDYKWYSIAVAQGAGRASENLINIESHITPEQIANAKQFSAAFVPRKSGGCTVTLKLCFELQHRFGAASANRRMLWIFSDVRFPMPTT